MQKNPCIRPLLLLLVLNASSHLSAASFEVLFPVDNAVGEKSILTSDDGSVVLSVHAGSGQHYTALWKESQGLVASYPPYGSPVPYCLSGDGQVILTFGASNLGIYDASYDGSVRVGVTGTFGTTQAAAIINGQIHDLGKLDPTDTSAWAWGVSADGKTVVGYSNGPTGRAAFRWTDETGMVALGTLPGITKRGGTALGISPAGDTIVGSSASTNGGQEAFRWTAATGMQPLGDLPGGFFASDAYATSDGGNLVVGDSFANFGTEAFIWDNSHGMRRLADVLTNDYHLDLQGLRLRNATDISASGNVIVGWGTDVSNNAFAFRVNLVPEPSTLISLTVALSVLASTRRRRNT